ncbi:hypothetical protein A9P82_00495 [Arachidicoccus ginsenosidimutans]|uniref:hypothetical protein n=1 Tax=Arachidicoccus sp. BS20 TaxID=1850526 RepID=UPI0007F11B58|nr:hypothetical protein [Arachidicoccus sp. BS20]ANI87927.1 hypothetical protein A9P82_00495 [Arachidicoccus sp. BS20]
MKNLFLIFAFAASTFAVKAQETKPTKEETITWIKEKLEKYIPVADGLKNFQILKIDETEVIYKYTDTYCDEKVNFPISDIKSVEIGNDGSNYIFFNSKSVHRAYCSNGNSYYSYVKIYAGEADICTRLEKAFKHLASFAQKKETF